MTIQVWTGWYKDGSESDEYEIAAMIEQFLRDIGYPDPETEVQD